MQLVKSQSNIVEKVLRDKEGRLVRARFQVYENAGRIKARLVDFVYLTEKAISSAVQALPGFFKKVTSRFDLEVRGIISPFITFEILHFSGSKPRAPTFA